MRVGEPFVDLSWLDEHLAVGASFPVSSVERLAREYAIRHVVDVRVEASDDAHVLSRHGIEFLHLPTLDHHAIAGSMLEQGVQWICARLNRRECVYVHCEHGIGRSVLLSMCTLVAIGEEPTRALARIKRARPCASPSPAQLDAYLAFVAPRVARVPSWDALAAIAYHGGCTSEPADDLDLSPRRP